jgi:PPK2 family polyphosphate:nucleotide phosphotransferase
VSGRDAERWVVRPGAHFAFADRDPRATDGAPGGKKATNAKLPKLARELAGLQDRLYAESSQALLVVLQAMDAGGKDGTVKHVFGGVNPQGVTVTSFKVPTPEELAHDFLWRIHAHAPRHGYIGIFNRSHYEDVLVARVHELVPGQVWRRRYGHINHFEELLHDAGVRIVKLCLHISPEEQAERLQARLDDPTKRWKFNPGDLAERERWDDYLAAYEEAIRETSTEHAPWYVVPADRKWFRNWAVSRIVLEALADMDPQYPPPAEGLDGITVT